MLRTFIPNILRPRTVCVQATYLLCTMKSYVIGRISWLYDFKPASGASGKKKKNNSLRVLGRVRMCVYVCVCVCVCVLGGGAGGRV